MRYTRAFLTIFLTINLSLCFSQNDWRSGYIITNENDTIHGFVDYRPSSENSLRCFFHKEKKGDTKKYKPGEIAGYRFTDGKFYVSKSIKTNDLEGTYFLEFLIQGKLNAYYLKFDNNLYFLEKDGELYLLKNTTKEEYINGTHYINEKKEYKGVMNYVLQDGDMQKDIMNCSLHHKPIIKISKKYHEKVCEDEECIIFEKKVKPVIVDFGIIAGSNMHTLHLYEDLSYDLKVENSFFGGIGFLISGIFMIIILKRKRIEENYILINFIGLRMVLYGIVFLILIILLQYNPFQVPQWILLISIGLLLEWNFIKRKKI